MRPIWMRERTLALRAGSFSSAFRDERRACAKLRARFGQFTFAPSNQHNPRTSLNHAARDAQADACSAAGDQGRLAGERKRIIHVRRLLFQSQLKGHIGWLPLFIPKTAFEARRAGRKLACSPIHQPPLFPSASSVVERGTSGTTGNRHWQGIRPGRERRSRRGSPVPPHPPGRFAFVRRSGGFASLHHR